MNWRNWVMPGAALALAGAAGVALIPHWVFPPIRSTDYGPAAMDQVVFKDSRAPVPAAQPEVMPASYGGPTAGAAYKNVTVLGAVSKGEFDRTMVAITKWVSPGQGCGFCHAAGQPYSADNPRKQIARQMLAMTRTVNANWTNHVGAQGVTCYSCHAGKNVPDERWHIDKPDEPIEGGLVGKPQEWNTQAKTIRNFFPSKPNRLFLLEGQSAGAVEGDEALARTGPRTNWQHDRTYTEHVYVFMMQMSNGMGVNCTYCHGARDFNWAESSPNRLSGYSGMVMTRMINQNYIAPLAAYTEPALLGAMGDAGKADCKTCHQGQIKPTGGMQHYVYPALIGPLPAAGAAPNVLAAANPSIPLLARRPQVGVPASDTVPQFKGEQQP